MQFHVNLWYGYPTCKYPLSQRVPTQRQGSPPQTEGLRSAGCFSRLMDMRRWWFRARRHTRSFSVTRNYWKPSGLSVVDSSKRDGARAGPSANSFRSLPKSTAFRLSEISSYCYPGSPSGHPRIFPIYQRTCASERGALDSKPLRTDRHSGALPDALRLRTGTAIFRG